MLKFNRWTLDLDAYYIHFQNGYSSVNDPADFNEAIYFPHRPLQYQGHGSRKQHH